MTSPREIEARIATNADTILRSVEKLTNADTHEAMATLMVAAAALARAEEMKFSDFKGLAELVWREIGNRSFAKVAS